MSAYSKLRSTPDEDGFVTSTRSWFPRPNKPMCVAVKIADGMVQVRDTKDPDKTTLSFSAGEWKAFIEAVKDGEFDIHA